MDVFTKLFGEFLVFVYHCFDRIVIHGYLTALSRPELVVHFFREIVGVAEVSKEALSQRTADYQNWVEAYARNHSISIEWAEKGVRKEDHVLPWLRRMAKRNAYGVYFIFKSMEQGPTYRVSLPKYPSKDPHYRILAHQRSRFTHYYFYIRDEVLGPMVLRVASFFPFQTTYYLNGHSFIEQELKRAGIGFRKHDNAFLAIADPAALQTAADRLSPDIIRRRLDYWTLILGPKFSKKERARLNLSRLYAISQIEYCRNFIFKRHFPIHKLFERSCELGLWRLGADKIAAIFGTRLNRRMRGKLATVIDQIEHGHHAFRAYFKSAFLKQYEKFSTFLRNELVSNNLNDFGLRKGLDHLDAVRTTFQAITDRFAGFQAEWLNSHVDFPLLQRLARPITVGAVRLARLSQLGPLKAYEARKRASGSKGLHDIGRLGPGETPTSSSTRGGLESVAAPVEPSALVISGCPFSRARQRSNGLGDLHATLRAPTAQRARVQPTDLQMRPPNTQPAVTRRSPDRGILPEKVLPSSGLKALPVQTLSPRGFMSKKTCGPTFAGPACVARPDDRAAEGLAAICDANVRRAVLAGPFAPCVAGEAATTPRLAAKTQHEFLPIYSGAGLHEF